MGVKQNVASPSNSPFKREASDPTRKGPASKLKVNVGEALPSDGCKAAISSRSAARESKIEVASLATPFASFTALRAAGRRTAQPRIHPLQREGAGSSYYSEPPAKTTRWGSSQPCMRRRSRPGRSTRSTDWHITSNITSQEEKLVVSVIIIILIFLFCFVLPSSFTILVIRFPPPQPFFPFFPPHQKSIIPSCPVFNESIGNWVSKKQQAQSLPSHPPRPSANRTPKGPKAYIPAPEPHPLRHGYLHARPLARLPACPPKEGKIATPDPQSKKKPPRGSIPIVRPAQPAESPSARPTHQGSQSVAGASQPRPPNSAQAAPAPARAYAMTTD